MSRSGSQQRTFVELLGRLAPWWRTDPALPVRVDRLLSGDRRLGSRDRRLYRELIYTAVRYLPWIEPHLAANADEAVRRTAWLARDTPATRALREDATQGLPPCPRAVGERAAILGEEAGRLLPGWLREECPAAFDDVQLQAIMERAPLWLRLQTSDAEPVFAEFRERGWTWTTSPAVPGAVALTADVDAADTAAYRSGRIEIQDAGSQRILLGSGVAPGGRWYDACAGAGGKSLQLAALVGAAGHVDAWDVRPQALEELSMRARRAGLGSRISITPPSGSYDGVLVDAPCSGSGTWRRQPHLKWTTTPSQVAARAAVQSELLAAASARVRPGGGKLVYATCSLCRTENEDVATAFLAAHPEFAPNGDIAANASPGRYFMPADHDGDGYYAAEFLRR